MTAKLFREALEHAIGGGWGSDESSEDSMAVRVIRGADFPAARISRLGEAPLRYEKIRKVETRKLELNDIVLEISGGTKGRPTGRTIRVTQEILDESAIPLIPASFCRLVRIDPRVVDPVFGYYALQDLYNNGGTWKFQNQSTGIANFQFEQFKANYSFPDVAYSEQRAIAEVLGALDDKIAANERAQDLLDQLVRLKFLQLEGQELPLGDLAENVRVQAGPDELSASTSYVGLEHIPRRRLWLSETGTADEVTSSKSRFTRNDVLFSKLRPYFHKVAIAPGEGVVSTDALVVRAKQEDLAGYVLAAASSDKAIDTCTANSTGTRMPRTKWEHLANVTFPWPGDLLAKAFSKSVIAKADFATALSDESARLASTRDELLPLLMSGKIRVKDAEKVVEEAT